MSFVRSSFGSFLNTVSDAASRVVRASDRTDTTNGDTATDTANTNPPADTSTTNTTHEAGATVVTDGGDESHELWKRLGELEASLPAGPTSRLFTEAVRLSIYEDCGG